MSTQLQVDTEGVEQTHAVISGHAGIAYSNKGIQNLVWNNGQYGFSLAGPVPLEDLLRVAESLREK
jgi:anti-sigma factor RsiW